MSAALLDYDKMEIAVYGREVQDVSRYYEPITEWFSTWFTNQMFRNKLLIIIGLTASVLAVIMLVIMLVNGIKKKSLSGFICCDGKQILLISVIFAGEIFWILTAPLVRYGMVYLMLPIALCYYIIEKCIGERINRYVIILGTCTIVCLFLCRSEDF